jgi:DNA-binding MarR family transcriptional regulator
VDIEARARADHHQALRVWLRLLTCSQLIEKRVRTKLRDSFATTLPRFDLMSQLERSPEGLKMSELSRLMMVTGGNVTTITDQLESEGLVERLQSPSDRRVYRIRLTQNGFSTFKAMALEHEKWIVECFAQLDEEALANLHGALGAVKKSVSSEQKSQRRAKQ